jgi:N-acetyl-alpha-D-muramate 1-phosphate uridylyltransferase
VNESGTRLPVAILAGGLATRLRPLTETVPKILLTIAGKPFLDYQLASLREQNLCDVVVCAGFLGEKIQEEFGDGRRHGVRIRYSLDGPDLLGTGGAVRRALPLLGGSFFVLYGDSLLQVDYAAVASAFFHSGRSALMTVFKNRDQWDASNVEYADGEIKEYNKKQRTSRMTYIDYGLGVYRSSVFEAYPATVPFDLADVLQDLAARKELAGYEAENRFYEIGSFAGLEELTRVMEDKACPNGKVVQTD